MTAGRKDDAPKWRASGHNANALLHRHDFLELGDAATGKRLLVLQEEFLGFNRARHAVLEATILATRTHLIPAEQIRDELARLQVIVDKTAGPREQEAMAFVTEHVGGR